MIASWSDMAGAYCTLHNVYGVYICGGQYDTDDFGSSDRHARLVKKLNEFGPTYNRILFIDDELVTFSRREDALSLYNFFNVLGDTYAREYAALFSNDGEFLDENT